MNRREFSSAAGLAAIGTLMAGSRAQAAPQALTPDAQFSRQAVVQLAELLAKDPYVPAPTVPEPIANLSYDQLRDIRFKPERALWANEGRGFTVDLLHAGNLIKNSVELFTVADGKVVPLTFNPDLFTYGPLLKDVKPPPPGVSLFSGIRIRAPINTPSHYDEAAVFQGASYFRSLGQDQLYGLSARGLAIDTGESKGEEFPIFKVYWIERPPLGAKAITVHALLDSPSAAGAYTFRIMPGASTIMDVEATLFARANLNHLGIAPLTSMFLFDATNRRRFDDFRSAVHDSDGLAIWRSNGEWIWRPLSNPRNLRFSAFQDENPAGFGLQQRADRYYVFEDIEAEYEKRPSLWVEPRVGWGRGQVELLEIPTDREINDNIVAFWRPDTPLMAGQSRTLSYWLRWGPPVSETTLGRVTQTRSGAVDNNPQIRIFVIDFAIPPMQENLVQGAERRDPLADVVPRVNVSVGQLRNVVGRRNLKAGGYRVSFEVEVGDAELSELRLVLTRGDMPVSETWLYRWTRE